MSEVSEYHKSQARHVRGIMSALDLCPRGDIGGPEYEQMERERRQELHGVIERLNRFDLFTLWNAVRHWPDALPDTHDALFDLWSKASDDRDRVREPSLWRIMRAYNNKTNERSLTDVVTDLSAKLPAGLERLAFDLVVGELVMAGLVDAGAIETDQARADLRETASLLDLGEIANVTAELVEVGP